MGKNSKFWSGEKFCEKFELEPFDLIDLTLNGALRRLAGANDIVFPFKTNDERQRSYISDRFPHLYPPCSPKTKEELIKDRLNETTILATQFSIELIEAFRKENPEYEPQDTPDMEKRIENLPYRDPNNAHFSKELDIAIETWLAIYGPDGSLNPSQKHRKQIIIYLNKKYPKLFPQKCELKEYWTYDKGKPKKKLPESLHRIVTMINADPVGGAEKSCT